MKTITAKNLRDNLSEIVKRIDNGESIRVTYRSKSAFMIQPDNTENTSVKPGSRAAMQSYTQQARALNKIPRQSELKSSTSIKELYHDMLDRNPKYQGNHE